MLVFNIQGKLVSLTGVDDMQRFREQTLKFWGSIWFLSHLYSSKIIYFNYIKILFRKSNFEPSILRAKWRRFQIESIRDHESRIRFGAPDRFVLVVKNQISIILHNKFVASVTGFASPCAPNCSIVSQNDHISVSLVDKPWISAVGSAGFWLPNCVSAYEMPGCINDKVAVRLKNCVISIGRLEVLIGNKSLAAFQVSLSLSASHHLQNAD